MNLVGLSIVLFDSAYFFRHKTHLGSDYFKAKCKKSLINRNCVENVFKKLKIV